MPKLYANFNEFIYRRKRTLKCNLSNKLNRQYTLNDIYEKVHGSIMTHKLNRTDIPLIELEHDRMTINEALSCLPQKDSQKILIRFSDSVRSVLIQTTACFKDGIFVL